MFLVANLGGKSQEPLLELRFPLDDKAVNASVVVTETEGLMNQEVMVGLIVLLAVGFILAKLKRPKVGLTTMTLDFGALPMPAAVGE